MTQGKIWRHLLRFALPIMGGMLLQMLYNTVDGIVVGNAVGEAALGAVNTSGSFVNLLLACATGLSTGASIVLSQFYGAGKTHRLRQCISTVLILMLCLGAALLVLGQLTTGLVLRHVLSVPEDTFAYASTYLHIYFLGLVFQFVYNALAAALQSVGNSRATLLFLVCSSIVNIVLDILFVAVFRFGVAGAAVATVIAQGVSVVLAWRYIQTRQKVLALSRGDIRFDRESCGMVLKVGIPVVFQNLIATAGTVFMQRLINSFGTSFMAAVAAGSRVEQFCVVPAISFGQAISVFSGQNAGAGNFKRLLRGLYTGLAMTLGLAAVLSGCLVIFARPLVALFGCTDEALALGIQYLRFMAVVLLIGAVLFDCRGLLQGVGDVRTTLAVTFGTLAFRVITAYVMAGIPSIGYRAVWYAMGLDFLVGSVGFIVRLASGKWKDKVIVHSDAPETEGA